MKNDIDIDIDNNNNKTQEDAKWLYNLIILTFIDMTENKCKSSTLEKCTKFQKIYRTI